MKRTICLLLVFMMCNFSLSAFAAVTKKSDDLGIQYASEWKQGIFEEIIFEKLQLDEGVDEWDYLLKIKVANSRQLSDKTAQLLFQEWYYEVYPFYTAPGNWRPYMLGQQTPKKTTPLILEISNANSLKITVTLTDGKSESVELPRSILEEWKSIIRAKQ